MTGTSRVLTILLFPFAFLGSLVLSELSFHLWPSLPNLLTVPVIAVIGLLGTVLLLVMKRRSLLITLPIIWLVWAGIMLPLLRQPSLVIEIESGCWPMDSNCGCNGVCGPYQVPTTLTDIAIYAVIGGVIITISSLFASLVWYAVWSAVTDWRTRGPEGDPPAKTLL